MARSGRLRAILLAIGVLATALIQGCSSSVDLYSGLSESDANDVVAALMRSGIDARKSASKQGFSVSVSSGSFGASIETLHASGLPRQAFLGLGDVFKKDGMISTPTEERARYLFALSQELEQTLMGIDGILMARVHPVLPERLTPGEPVQAASCSVLIKHRAGWDSTLYEERIRRLVVSGIPGLATAPAANVSVVFVQAEEGSGSTMAVSGGIASRAGSSRALIVTLAALVAVAGCCASGWLVWRSRGRALDAVAPASGHHA